MPGRHPVPAPAARDRYATTWRHTLTVTIGLGTVVGLVGWPLPTAYALCAATGALALTAGLLRLRGELTAQPNADELAGCAGCIGCGGPDCPDGCTLPGCRPDDTHPEA